MQCLLIILFILFHSLKVSSNLSNSCSSVERYINHILYNILIRILGFPHSQSYSKISNAQN